MYALLLRSFSRRVPLFPETGQVEPGAIRGVLRVPDGHRSAGARAPHVVQSPGVHDPLAVVLHGDKRGVQGLTGQLHDGAAARTRVHPDGPDTRFGPDHDG